LRCDFSSASLILLLPFAYGVAEGEAVGEADSSAAAFFFVVFFAAADADGDASVEADVFFVVDFLLVVDAAWVVVPVDVIAVSSFFWDWQPRKTPSVSTVIKDKTGVFIELVKLNKDRECRDASPRASIKIAGFLLSNL